MPKNDQGNISIGYLDPNAQIKQQRIVKLAGFLDKQVVCWPKCQRYFYLQPVSSVIVRGNIGDVNRKMTSFSVSELAAAKQASNFIKKHPLQSICPNHLLKYKIRPLKCLGSIQKFCNNISQPFFGCVFTKAKGHSY